MLRCNFSPFKVVSMSTYVLRYSWQWPSPLEHSLFLSHLYLSNDYNLKHYINGWAVSFCLSWLIEVTSRSLRYGSLNPFVPYRLKYYRSRTVSQIRLRHSDDDYYWLTLYGTNSQCFGYECRVSHPVHMVLKRLQRARGCTQVHLWCARERNPRLRKDETHTGPNRAESKHVPGQFDF